MIKKHKIITPENVEIDYELAGLGSRYLAFAIDISIQILFFLMLAIVMLILLFVNQASLQDFFNNSILIEEGSSLIIALVIILVFFVLSGYFIFFEYVLNGQTPGKKLIGIKVIKATGEPMGIFENIGRNILRVADFLPGFYFLGCIFILGSKNNLRIGDLAANTIVVRFKKVADFNVFESFGTDSGFSKEKQNTKYALENPLTKLTNEEQAILRLFIDRKEQMGSRRKIFEFHFTKYFSEKFGIKEKIEKPFEFFKNILED